MVYKDLTDSRMISLLNLFAMFATNKWHWGSIVLLPNDEEEQYPGEMFHHCPFLVSFHGPSRRKNEGLAQTLQSESHVLQIFINNSPQRAHDSTVIHVRRWPSFLLLLEINCSIKLSVCKLSTHKKELTSSCASVCCWQYFFNENICL